MGPTGTGTNLVVLCVAVALTLVCLREWAPGRSAAPVDGVGAARRSGSQRPLRLLLACQLSWVVLVVVVANDYQQRYSSWDELFDGHAGRVVAVHANYSAPAGIGGAPGSPEAGPENIPAAAATWSTLPWSSPAEWPQRGAIVKTEVTGPVSGLAEQAWVYLPPGYFHQGPSARRMPLIEVFTGYPGTVKNQVTKLHYPDLLLSEIQTGSAADAVLVMLQPSPTYPWDTECSDIPGGPQALKFFTTDVPDAVRKQFALRPRAYGAIGDSTGGYCAAKLAMLDPARFTAAAMLSGYYAPATDPSTRGAFADPVVEHENNLRWLLLNRPAPPISLLLATSPAEHGPDGWETNQRLLRAVRPPMSAEALVLPNGRHNFDTWSREIPYALSWLSEHLGGRGGTGSKVA